MKTEYELCKMAERKILDDSIFKLTTKEVDAFLEGHWLEYTMRYDLSPCGHLTMKGKLQYFENNKDILIEIIKEFPVEEMLEV